MDNIQFWLYVIVAVIYLISAARKKAKKQNQPEDFPETTSRPTARQYDEPATQKPKPITFEELLREITEGKQATPPPPVLERSPEYSRPKPQPEYVDYDDEIEAEEKSLEETTVDEERTTKIYEDAKKLAFYRPSLEETLKVQDVNTTYGKFAAFETKQDANLMLEYTKDLRDPKGFKKALILSEILNRKHF